MGKKAAGKKAAEADKKEVEAIKAKRAADATKLAVKPDGKKADDKKPEVMLDKNGKPMSKAAMLRKQAMDRAAAAFKSKLPASTRNKKSKKEKAAEAAAKKDKKTKAQMMEDKYVERAKKMQEKADDKKPEVMLDKNGKPM